MNEDKSKLTRSIGLFGAIMILIGTIIGSGIFMVPGKIAAVAKAPGPDILAWVIAGVVCTFFALVYAELAPMLPKAGGAYVYIREAYGNALSFFYGWTSVFGGYSSILGLLSVAFVNYLTFFIPSINETTSKIISTVLLIGLAYINIRGVKLSSIVNNIFTVGKLSVIGLVIIGGIFLIKGENFTPFVSQEGWGTTAAATVPAILAFGGYTAIAYMSEEIKDPGRTIPLAQIIGILSVIGIYILLNVVSIGVMPIGELAESSKPVAAVATKIFGTIGGGIVALGALVSIFGSLNASIMQFARVPFSMSRDGLIFNIFGKIHPKYKTPYVSILLITIVTIVLVWTGTFMSLLLMSVFIGRIMDCLTAIGLIILRKKRPDLERPAKMPGYPFTTIGVVILMGYLLTKVPVSQIQQSIYLAASSVPAFLLFKYFNSRKLREQN